MPAGWYHGMARCGRACTVLRRVPVYPCGRLPSGISESRVAPKSFAPDDLFVHARRLTEAPGAEDGGKEACGIFGVFAPGEDVARLTFYGLYALQHRGQES